MSDARICSIEGCGKPKVARGWCSTHYQVWGKYGVPIRPARVKHKFAVNFLEDAKEYRGEECLIWPYSKDHKGYGKITIDEKTLIVSRLVCEAVNGPSPTPTSVAAHNCGKGQLGCVAGSHMRWATHIENAADRIIHGTHVQGSAITNSKLTEKDISEIKQMVKTTSQANVARKYNVSPATICLLLSGKTWKHVV